MAIARPFAMYFTFKYSLMLTHAPFLDTGHCATARLRLPTAPGLGKCRLVLDLPGDSLSYPGVPQDVRGQALLVTALPHATKTRF